jgi:hypothetical protein
MLAAVRNEKPDCIQYYLTSDPEAIVADEDAMFVNSIDELSAELAVRHPTPEGFKNQVFYNINYVSFERLNRFIEVEGLIELYDHLEAVTKDRAKIEATVRSMPEAKVHVNPEIFGIKDFDKYNILPVGDFLFEKNWNYCWVLVYNPKKAKKIRARRAGDKKSRIKRGQPALTLLNKMYTYLWRMTEKHSVMRNVLQFSYGHSQCKACCRASYYSQIMGIARAYHSLFGHRGYQQSEEWMSVLKELILYADGMAKLEKKEVPSPKFEKRMCGPDNRSAITKSLNYNNSVDAGKRFVIWLRIQYRATFGVDPE